MHLTLLSMMLCTVMRGRTASLEDRIEIRTSLWLGLGLEFCIGARIRRVVPIGTGLVGVGKTSILRCFGLSTRSSHALHAHRLQIYFFLSHFGLSPFWLRNTGLKELTCVSARSFAFASLGYDQHSPYLVNSHQIKSLALSLSTHVPMLSTVDMVMYSTER